jgi:cell division protein FtsA
VAESKKYPGKTVFGLDIGTRTVVGTVGYKKGNEFCVIAQRSVAHDSRAMIDGQIHDIIKVGETVAKVRRVLEEATTLSLDEVCIAAAGRVLRTVTCHVEWPFVPEREVTKEDIYALASMGVEQAYADFEAPADTEARFFCVGHSIVRYYLNGYQIGNLEGHKAKVIGADVIATFLPDDVVNGLYRTVEQAELDIVSMTLEPIAAIQVAIPEKYRMLNIALVDVGAGTSDISISKDGSIIAYGMIAKAGDALTEVIAASCLVDFATAEQMKHDAGEMDVVTYKDIMFLPQDMPKEKVLEMVDDVLKEMARDVAEAIRSLNGGKSVSAVFVVGGGGKIPGYTAALADELGIARERVALRGEEVMQEIVFEEVGMKKDSLLVTPIGICLNYYEQSNNFIFVSFNGQRLKIYDNNRLSVVDAAIQAQFPNDAFFPRRGKALVFQLDGSSRMVRGQAGETAEITVNGEAADIHTPIHSNDVIVVKESTAGEAGKATLANIKELKDSIVVIINGTEYELPRPVWVGGELKPMEYEISEGDEIELAYYYTVGQIAGLMGVALTVDDDILVNEKEADRKSQVYDNFTVTWTLTEDSDTGEASAFLRRGKGQAKNTRKAKGGRKSTANAGEEATSLTVSVNSSSVLLSGKSDYVFVDVFEYFDFDLNGARGRHIITKLNGRVAQFMEPLAEGDVIDVFWDD